MDKKFGSMKSMGKGIYVRSKGPFKVAHISKNIEGKNVILFDVEGGWEKFLKTPTTDMWQSGVRSEKRTS
jgi:hypothetical protein